MPTPPPSKRHESKDWSIEVPEGWNCTPGKFSTTIAHPESAGVLQISSFRKKNPLTREELQEFAGNVPISSVTFGCLSGIRSQFSEGDTFWTKWWLRTGGHLIHATHNCPIEDKGFDDKAIEGMLKTLIPK
jgi:hypothetical protein